VTSTGPQRLEAELFHFGRAARPMGAELYLLQPGPYRWTLAAGQKLLQEGTLTVSGPRAQIRFELPSRQACRLTLSPG
jgi:hypothetical protein